MGMSYLILVETIRNILLDKIMNFIKWIILRTDITVDSEEVS